MNCPNIGEIRFSQISVDAIEEIRRIKRSANLLIHIIGAGTVVNIFLGNDALKSAYSLYSTDFEYMAKAMDAVPIIEKRRILDVAKMAYLDTINYKEKQFWSAVVSGCSN